MAIGDTSRTTFVHLSDPVTGRPVTRLTDLTVHCHHPYFYYRMFTPDGGKLLYVSDRTGHRNAYLLELATGTSVQLTDCRRLSDFSCHLSPDGRGLYSIEDQQMRYLDFATLRERTLFVQEYPWTGSGVNAGYSVDCRQALLCQMHVEDVVRGLDGWDFFKPQWEAKPRCRLVLVDLDSGKETVVLEERLWLGHPQIRPGHPHTLMYCHEGPGDCVDARIWMIEADGKHKRWMGYRKDSPDPARRGIVTHEYFTADGRCVSFAYYPERWAVDGSLRLVDVETTRESIIGRCTNYCHQYHSPDGRYVVGDERNLEHPEKACLWLVETATGRERCLGLHGSCYGCHKDVDTGRMNTQDCHPHAAFSPDSRQVVFTSDRETGPGGNCAVYLTSIEGVFEP